MSIKKQYTNYRLAKKYFNSLDGHEKAKLSKKGIYHPIYYKNKKAGIVGYVPDYISNKAGFVQIVIDKPYRGLGLAQAAENELARKHHLKTLIATISKKNTVSIQAHKKMDLEHLIVIDWKD